MTPDARMTQTLVRAPGTYTLMHPEAETRSEQVSTDRFRPSGRIPRWLRQPLSMLLLIPGLMVLAGGSLVAINRFSLSAENGQNWRDRLGDHSATIAALAARTLNQAYPLLMSICANAPGRTNRPDDLTRLLIDLENSRSGILALSVVDEHGVGLRVSESSPTGVAHVDRYVGGLPTTTVQVDASPTGDSSPWRLDPVQHLVIAETHADALPHWSTVYRSVRTGLKTISCAQALAWSDGQHERVVALVDFDSLSIDLVLAGVIPPGDDSRPFIFTVTGLMLVGPTHVTEQGSDEGAGARSFADALAALPAAGAVRFIDHTPRGLPVLAAIRRIDLVHGPDLYASVVAPYVALAATTRALIATSMWIEMGAVVGAATIAWLLIRLLTHQRRQVVHARASARAAKARLEELGSYALIRRLGAGGMGEVWQAEHQLLARPAALKVISMRSIASTEAERSEARARFAREARATARLRSPHTVTIYDFGFTRDGAFFYAMELLDGLDLERLVQEDGPQHPSRVIKILIQVCKSLAEAHQLGLVHRDIKPANIYLCRLGLEVDVAKVFDFGLVADRKGHGRTAASGVAQGTPAYMAPEQAQGLGTDGRSDLYALGAVAYWLLSGMTLFDEDDAFRTLAKQVHSTPRPLTQVARQIIPAPLLELIDALLAKDPDRRPATAQAVIAQLEPMDRADEELWPAARARAWWTTHRPPLPLTPSAGTAVRTVTIHISEPALL
jgi:tRNA A-37 threonylcarbamoyl transferase component Bud32